MSLADLGTFIKDVTSEATMSMIGGAGGAVVSTMIEPTVLPLLRNIPVVGQVLGNAVVYRACFVAVASVLTGKFTDVTQITSWEDVWNALKSGAVMLISTGAAFYFFAMNDNGPNLLYVLPVGAVSPAIRNAAHGAGAALVGTAVNNFAV